MSAARTTLGIIAGGGSLPAQLIETCQSIGRPCFVIALEDFADMNSITHVPYASVRLGAVGAALEHLRNAGVKEIVLAGKVRRPSLASLRPDATGARLIARLGAAFLSGDDALLKSVMAFLEDEGFTVVGSNDILSALAASEGALGRVAPNKQALQDITQGVRILKALGSLDIGQAVIIENSYVLGVEAAEGTDALIKRCAGLKREAEGGVLVKFRKIGQDQRVDLPAIGPDTVKAVHGAGFSGIAVEADGAIIVNRDATIADADSLGIFIVGVRG